MTSGSNTNETAESRSTGRTEQRSEPGHVLHVGPRADEPGGMATVVGALCEAPPLGYDADRLVSFDFRERFYSVRTWINAGRRLRSRKFAPRELAHVHISQRGSLLRDGLLVLMLRKTGRPVCVTIHGSSYSQGDLRYGRLIRALLGSDCPVTVLFPALRDELRRIGMTNVYLVRNPVQDVSCRESVKDTAPIAVFAGEVSLRKGADVLAEAWKLVIRESHDAELLVLGPVHWEGSFPPRATLRGAVPRSEVRDAICRARVGVLPSRAEGMPMFLLECMQAGRPVISTPVGAVPEAVGPGGSLVPTGDAKKLAEAILTYLRDPGLAHAIGTSAREHVRANFSIERVNATLADVYESTIKSGRDRP